MTVQSNVLLITLQQYCIQYGFDFLWFKKMKNITLLTIPKKGGFPNNVHTKKYM